MSLRSGWRLAIGTLTILPSGPVDPSASAARWLVALAPIAVLPLAVGAAAVSAAGTVVGAPGLVTGLLVVGLLAILTRGMHLDAVADVADGTGAGWDPERARAVMKRGDIGPMGVIALIVVLGLQAASIAAVTATPNGWLLIGIVVAASRWLLAPVCAGVPAMPGSSLGAV
ncbi:MAG: adenosylcobinamide-GDP ribazoletransferase, partial [Propionibacteriaceae bacterium]|nr:adenosylcobinamide-GDP ribazoletransferase [Propionibacteriaceae bacterium]